MSKTARNDITNDLIQTRKTSETFDKNYDQIDWSVKLVPADTVSVEQALEECIKDNHELLSQLKD